MLRKVQAAAKVSPLKASALASDVGLQEMLRECAFQKPERQWRQLCEKDYHTTMREITNYRARCKRAVRDSALPAMSRSEAMAGIAADVAGELTHAAYM